MEKELTPFVQDVFEVPQVMALYLNVLGIQTTQKFSPHTGSILIAYSGLRLIWAFVDPFVPRLECGALGNCLKCIKLCGQSTYAVVKELAKPWIHVPLIVGILMTFFCVAILFVA